MIFEVIVDGEEVVVQKHLWILQKIERLVHLRFERAHFIKNFSFCRMQLDVKNVDVSELEAGHTSTLISTRRGRLTCSFAYMPLRASEAVAIHPSFSAIATALPNETLWETTDRAEKFSTQLTGERVLFKCTSTCREVLSKPIYLAGFPHCCELLGKDLFTFSTPFLNFTNNVPEKEKEHILAAFSDPLKPAILLEPSEIIKENLTKFYQGRGNVVAAQQIQDEYTLEFSLFLEDLGMNFFIPPKKRDSPVAIFFLLPFKIQKEMSSNYPYQRYFAACLPSTFKSLAVSLSQN